MYIFTNENTNSTNASADLGKKRGDGDSLHSGAVVQPSGELQDIEYKCHNTGKRQEAGGRGYVNGKAMGI